ncbi:putative xyloglucan endotransglucosylase/hydrolase protein 30 [Cinnamomum micranthum f. kanehirae]|uniref:Xyloglucan endotransglucosylase/hydrolase n=1 Tax=Cinnamomum micranthum f. kanehirae TaxID=337451 RepID=A0A443P0V4_9MAGN|nr:putative xyloglucan endotransglucosylase/hydrolase protein 30 [Cinnamomum micranthum f. kanehirae]
MAVASFFNNFTFISFFLLSLSCISTFAFNGSTLSFDDAYSPLFGDENGNIVRSSDGKTVRLLLDSHTGSGFISSSPYSYGFFGASIKLPSYYTAGIVVAFYTSNGDIFEKTHDELDFEFLGNIDGKPWRVQTNLYGNGSTSRGREERYQMWFDPSKEFHRYSILWTPNNIIFSIDDVPIREVVHNDAMGRDYPSKPMSIYATIWDASSWATAGGRYKVNYKYAPFVSEYTDLVLQGCAVDPIQQVLSANCSGKEADMSNADHAVITPERRVAMQKFRERYMTYSYCYDLRRYPVPPPECVIVPSEQKLFKDTGRKLRFRSHHQRQSKRRSELPVAKISDGQAAM